MYFYQNKPSQRPATIFLVIFFAALGGFYYISFLLNPNNIGNLLPYILVLIAELFFVIQSLIVFWTMLVGEEDPRDYKYFDTQKKIIKLSGLKINKKIAKVNVFITVYGEPLEVIKKTVKSARDMKGKHQTYILDDGKSDEVKDLAKKLKVEYIRRDNNEGAKAGNINHALSITESDFFVIFDADHVPNKNFLLETLPFFYDDNLAFVQTPQHFEEMANFISKGSGYAQRVFYTWINKGKNKFNSAFCVGTNVIFRTSIINDMGGIYQKSNSEDIWTSILIHEKGYKSIFISDILAEGQAPETTKAYVKQQQRWATGGLEIFFKHNPLFAKLSLDQKIQYLSTSMFYFSGVASLFLFILPSIYIFFGLIPIQSEFGIIDWAIRYSVFYILQICVAFYFMKGFRWETMIVAFVSFPIYLKSLWNVITGQDEKWNVTNRKDEDSPFNYIVPQIVLFLFLIITTVIGGFDLFWYRNSGILAAFIWNLINTFIFGFFLWITYKEKRLMSIQDNQIIR